MWPSIGGGFYAMAIAMTDVLVRGNTAGEGGGLSANQPGAGEQSITIADCLFQGNSADIGGGYADDTHTHYYLGPQVVRTVFSANSARAGGGMYAQSANGYEVTFSDNLATEVGGGLYTTGPSSLADTRFLRNVAPQGGAIALEWSSLGLYGDLGSGLDDNSDDIFLVSAGATYADYGADVIVGCSDDDPAWCAVAPPPAEAAEPVVTAGTDTGSAGTRRSARRWPTRLPDRPWTCARETGPPTSC